MAPRERTPLTESWLHPTYSQESTYAGMLGFNGEIVDVAVGLERVLEPLKTLLLNVGTLLELVLVDERTMLELAVEILEIVEETTVA